MKELPGREKILKSGMRINPPECICLYLFLILSALTFTTPVGLSQEITRNEKVSVRFSIVYTGEISEGKSHGIGRKLEDLLAGNPDIRISKPVNIFAAGGDIWIISQGNGLVIKNKNGDLAIPQGIKKAKTEYPSLAGIAGTPAGDILFSDSRLNKVFILTADGKSVRCLNENLKLNQPTGLAFSFVKNELWIVETAAHRITVTDLAGNIRRSIGRRGNAPGEFNFPTAIWIDKAGTAYIIDALNFRIQMFDMNGVFISSFGKAGDATGYFARPKGIATDTFGNIYVSDVLFNAIQVFDRTGQLLYYFGNQGHGREQFWMPSGIFIDNTNNIYIADSYNTRIQTYKVSEESK